MRQVRQVIAPSWSLSEREVTSEAIYEDRKARIQAAPPGRASASRREFLKRLGGAAASAGAYSLSAGLIGCGGQESAPPRAPGPTSTGGSEAETPGLYPAPRNAAFRVDRPLTPQGIAGRYNNFYEFTTDKEDVAEMSATFPARPWTVTITGEVHRAGTFDVDALERRMPLEERVYRFRCVEAWAMVVPWTGFPLRALLERVQPTSQARYVRFITAHMPEHMPGIRQAPWYPWPYFEGLTMEEAMNDLTLLATGIYGHRLPPQHGAPIRLITPWKYGFKSIKSIARIELVRDLPETFWHRLQPAEYGFLANVNPYVPHPRWSQASERMIDTGQRVPTRPYNGYAEAVASMYPPLRRGELPPI